MTATLAASSIGSVWPSRDTATAGPVVDAGTAPAGMRWIPAGEFTMGTDDKRSMPNERPAHRVRVAGFWIDEKRIRAEDLGMGGA